LRFMERIAPMVDAFSTMGVVVPFPGTPIYDEFHMLHGFTDWWLRPEYSRYSGPPPIEDFQRYYRYYIDDANLELDFFHYQPDMKALIRECLRFKAEHNLERMGLLPRWGCDERLGRAGHSPYLRGVLPVPLPLHARQCGADCPCPDSTGASSAGPGRGDGSDR
jgi:hypothetical protein